MNASEYQRIRRRAAAWHALQVLFYSAICAAVGFAAGQVLFYLNH